ncbi:DUF1036 domain-containing protein [Tritonibacter litoralis]|nr:DUF1036 domain-containing protein [Tritonibacter litoralis]
MRWFLGIIIALAMLCPVTPAWAGFHLCNDTADDHHVAFTQKTDGAWVSQGWRSVPADDCVTLISQDLTSRFYYLRLRDLGVDLVPSSVKFCASDQDFRGTGSTECHRQSLSSLDFARIDVGRDTSDFTQQISALLPQDDVSKVAQRTLQAVFESCRVAPGGNGPLCSFVGQDRQILTRLKPSVPKSLARRLMQLPTGALVRLTVTVFHDSPNALEVKVLEAAHLPADEAHKQLMDLQGTWVSTIDPNDSFTVHGPSRMNFYLGAATTREFLSVSPQCLGHVAQGGFTLHAWSKDDTKGLCYQIDRLDREYLTLRFLPSGQALEYIRKPGS